MNNETIEFLNELSIKLGTTTERVIEAQAQVMVAEFWAGVVATLVFSLLALKAGGIAYREGSKNWREERVGVTTLSGVAAVFCLIAAVLGMVAIFCNFAVFFDAESAAIIKLIGGGCR
jgi:cation transport ATPase